MTYGPTIASGYLMAPARFHFFDKNKPAPDSLFVKFHQDDIVTNCLRGIQIMCLTSPLKFNIDLDFCSSASRARFKVLCINEGVTSCRSDIDLPERSLYMTTLEIDKRDTFFKIVNFIVSNNTFDDRAQVELDDALARARTLSDI